MTLMQSIFVILSGLILFFFLFHLLKTGNLLEKFTLTWMVICIGAICTPIFYPVMLALAQFWGIVDVTSFFFAAAIILLFLLGLQFSYEHSIASRQRRQLIIENALLSERVKRMEAALEELRGAAPRADTQTADDVNAD